MNKSLAMLATHVLTSTAAWIHANTQSNNVQYMNIVTIRPVVLLAIDDVNKKPSSTSSP